MNTMKKLGFRVGVLLTILLAVGATGAGAAETGAETEGKYRPVVFAYRWDEADGPTAWLLGGNRDGTWYGHIALPVLVNGKPVLPERAIEFSEPVACVTPLLEKGRTLAFYSATDGKIGSGTVKETKYSCSPASTESFIDVETDGPALPAHTLCLAVGEGWNALPAPTVRTVETERAAFAAGTDAAKMTATFLPAIDEYGESIWRGTIAYGGKSWPLTDAFAEKPDLLEGLFIDLDGDGRVEFVLHSPGIAGFIAVWTLDDEGPKEIMTLDLGD